MLDMDDARRQWMIKQIQHAGRGYSFEVARAKMVYGLVPENEDEVIPPDWW
jgi:predicted amidohydrolase